MSTCQARRGRQLSGVGGDVRVGGWIIRIYHDFVQGQGNPPECQRFAVHDEACRVVDVANL